MTTTKRDLARTVAQEVWCSYPEALAMVEAVFAGMREKLIQGNRIEVRGFGVLEVRKTRPRPQARNPRTGAVVAVPARRRVHFKPGRLLRDALQAPRSESSRGKKKEEGS